MKNGSPAKVVSKQSRTGLSSLAEARLRRSLRRTAPSEPWVDAQFVSVVEHDGRGEHIRRVHDARVFPPGGAQTAMRRCPRCGVFTPPAAFEAGVCLDHAEHGNWGRSPSAVAIAALQHLNLRLIDPPLPSESVTALRAEIARFNKGSRLPKGSGNPKRKKEPAAGKGGGGNLSGECRRCS
jgi:hypothetical protein